LFFSKVAAQGMTTVIDLLDDDSSDDAIQFDSQYTSESIDLTASPKPSGSSFSRSTVSPPSSSSVNLTEDSGASSQTPDRRRKRKRATSSPIAVNLDSDDEEEEKEFWSKFSSAKNRPPPAPVANTSSSSSSSSNSSSNSSSSSSSSSSSTDDTVSSLENDPDLDNTKVIEMLKKKLTCPICQDDIKEMASTKCGHIFCFPCIQECAKKMKKCATCRKKLTLNGIFRIYC